MKIIQCNNAHYYDSEKYDTCPYCQEESLYPVMDEEDKTIYHSWIETEEDVTLAYSEGIIPDEKTIGAFNKSNQMERVTGWLVCVDGEKKGASYQIGTGRNFIGRSLDMDICFSEDLSVSRRNHCAIVYDDKCGQFYIVPGNGMVLLKEKVVTEPGILKEDMRLLIGESTYEFIPYCNERRKWE